MTGELSLTRPIASEPCTMQWSSGNPVSYDLCQAENSDEYNQCTLYFALQKIKSLSGFLMVWLVAGSIVLSDTCIACRKYPHSPNILCASNDECPKRKMRVGLSCAGPSGFQTFSCFNSHLFTASILLVSFAWTSSLRSNAIVRKGTPAPVLDALFSPDSTNQHMATVQCATKSPFRSIT